MNLRLFNLRITKIFNSFRDIKKEIKDIEYGPLKGFAFVHPLISYSYDLRRGRRVITDMGLGRIESFIKGEYTVAIMLEKKKFVIYRHPKNVNIVVILGQDKKFKPLSEHDWKYVLDKVRNKATSFPVTYRHTTHGNYALSDAYKKYWDSKLGNLE